MRRKVDPTPEQIIERCEFIRSRWSAAEEQRRRQITNPEWVTPFIALDNYAAEEINIEAPNN